MTHSLEPWTDGGFCRIYNAEGKSVAITAGEGSSCGSAENIENARRIVACVNACGGFDTDDIESLTRVGGTLKIFLPSGMNSVEMAKRILEHNGIAAPDQIRDFARDIVGHIVQHYRHLGANISPETEALITQAAESFADSRFPTPPTGE